MSKYERYISYFSSKGVYEKRLFSSVCDADNMRQRRSVLTSPNITYIDSNVLKELDINFQSIYASVFAHGKIRTTYDENLKRYNIHISDLSEKMRKLARGGYLYCILEYKDWAIQRKSWNRFSKVSYKEGTYGSLDRYQNATGMTKWRASGCINNNSEISANVDPIEFQIDPDQTDYTISKEDIDAIKPLTEGANGSAKKRLVRLSNLPSHSDPIDSWKDPIEMRFYLCSYNNPCRGEGRFFYKTDTNVFTWKTEP